MKRFFSLVFSGMSLVGLAGLALAVEPVTVIPASADAPAAPALTSAPMGDCNSCGGGSCGSGCCQPSCCSSCCDQDCGRGGIYAGVGVYWIQPNFESNMAFGTVSANGDTVNLRDFRYSMRLAPQIFVGAMNDDGFGARVRWWYFDQSAQESIVNGGGNQVFTAFPLGEGIVSNTNGDVINTSSDLSLQVWDLEATQEVSHGCWSAILSGGVRYAHMSQNYVANLTNAAGQRLENLAGSHNFNGVGPTICIDGRRRMGNGGLSLYGLARGSLLFGTAKETVFDETIILGEDSDLDSADRRQADVLPIVETEVGAEFSRDMGNARLFIQLGLVGQAWLGGGNGSNNDIGGFPENTANFGFIGLTGRVGVGF